MSITEETALKLVDALNRHSEALESTGKLKIMTRQELQTELGVSNQTMQKIFDDPEFKAQRMGRGDFATVQAIENYLTNNRHERNSEKYKKKRA